MLTTKTSPFCLLMTINESEGDMAQAELAYQVLLSLGRVNRIDARGRRPVFVEVKCRYFSTSINTGVRLLPSQYATTHHVPSRRAIATASSPLAVAVVAESAYCVVGGLLK